MYSRYLRFKPDGDQGGGDPLPAATPAPAAGDLPPAADPPAGDPPAEPPADPPSPIDYTLSLPENSTLDPAAIERTVAIARARGLSNEAAQAALELANTEVASARDAILASHQPGGAEWAKQETAWRDAALADPELGNGNPDTFAATTGVAKRAFDTFATPEFVEMMTKSGFGSHPEVLRVFARIGAATAEPKIVDGPPARPTGTVTDRLYPSMNEKQ